MAAACIFLTFSYFLMIFHQSLSSNLDLIPTVVQTGYGKVKGSRIGSVSVFTRIPYAAPPVGDLRFRAPKPPQSWTGILDGSKGYGKSCLQITGAPFYGPGSEDCLYLNVLSPNISADPPLPVMFWIHGGCYSFGGAEEFTLEGIANNLATNGVVVVNINYRLNAFGFFSTKTNDFPGNWGMLDQVQALKWVQQEIRNFGGDPNRVTIFGQSAGGSSVSLLTYSPLAKGLFKQAIIQAGSALTTWAWNGSQNRGTNASREFAINSGCITEEEWGRADYYEKLNECLRSKPADQLFEAASRVKRPDFTWQCPWEPEIGDFTEFLPTSLDVLRKYRSQYDIMMGSCKDETSEDVVGFDYHEFIWRPFNLSNYDRSYFDSVVNEQIFIEKVFGKCRKPLAQVASWYYGDQKHRQPNDGLTWFQSSVDLSSDYAVNSGMLKEALHLLNEGSKVYLFSFDHLSTNAPWYSSYKGVPHGYEMLFQFGDVKNPTSEDYHVMDVMGRLYTNFAKTGDPNSPKPSNFDWRSISKNSPAQYLSINSRPEMRKEFHWDSFMLFNETFATLKSSFNELAGAEICSMN